jgi:myo-inositol-1(or 4)-monophosphatase
MSFNPREITAFATDLACEAGALVAAAREDPALAIGLKADRDLLTSADLASERLIVSSIKARFPDHQILAEESAPVINYRSESGALLWVIDPIDGTVNFAHRRRQSAVSIGFVAGGLIQAGVVHAPFLKETFSAVRGQGAFLNGSPI